MAATPSGTRLTEQHRAEQAAVQDAFLVEFLALWALLDQTRPEVTGEAWVRAVLALVRRFRRRSRVLADEYYRAFRLAEIPDAEVIELPRPVVLDRDQGGDPTPPPPAADPDDEGDPDPEVDEAEAERQADAAARRSLELMGPLNIVNRRRLVQPPERIERAVLVQAAGAGARHVGNGGRDVLMRDTARDGEALGWIRVTRENPCAFCAMLASRGPRLKGGNGARRAPGFYASRWTAGFSAHDNCRCYPEPVFHADAAWPGRGREFQQLWDEFTQGYSGKDALNAFRREYERQLRESRRLAEAA